MRTIPFSLILLIFLACNKPKLDERFPMTKQELEKMTNYPIESSDLVLKLPPNYDRFSINEYVEILKKSDLESYLKQYQYNVLMGLKEEIENAELLIDTISLQQMIWIMPNGPYIKLDEKIARIGLMQYLGTMNRSWIIETEKMINDTLIKRREFRYIKWRVEQQHIEQQKRFLNHYLISTSNQTLGISFISLEDIDYQGYVDRIEVD